MKILMIGNKESGKTTYMASAFGLLNDGVAGFHINTDSNTRTWYRKLFQAIKDGAYPNASDKRDSHSFKLDCLGRNVLDFEWVDYNGGIIKSIDADEFMNDIDSCDGVMLFFDAKALYDNNPSVHSVRRILSLISQKLGSIESLLFSVILIVTKVDLLDSVEDYAAAIKPLNAFIDNAKNNEKIYARIVPVSCSQNGFYNVELPILDILDSGLKTSYLNAAYAVQEHAEKATEYARKSGIIDWIGSKLSGTATYGELAKSRMEQAKRQLNLLESIEQPMKKLSDYVTSYELKWPVPNSYNHKKSERTKTRQLIKF